MRTDMERARSLLDREGYTCVLCKGDRVYTGTQRGVMPLLRWLDSGLDMKYFSAADKVVGKATAMLYVLLGVKEVYARVMSKAAVKLLLRHSIAILWDEQVDFIQNRQGDGPCPMEQAVWELDDPHEGLAAIRKKLAELQN